MSKAEQYAALREKGMTYAEIARKYGVTRQAVCSRIHEHKENKICVKPATVAFPGLRKWMIENHVFVATLERKTGKHLRRALSTGNINVQNIAAILEATGLTYEQAFGSKYEVNK